MKIRKRKISNNNKMVICLLAKESFKHNRGRNIILTMTTALSIMVLCTIFSLAFGKIEAEYFQSARSNGTVATTFLERGTMEQYEEIRMLKYIEAVGRKKIAGSFFQDNQYVAEMEVLDETAWKTMTVPAYTHIQGKYPQKTGEMMLSVRGLEEMGIQNPKIGMELSLKTALSETKVKKSQVFSLCGWYTDYVDPAQSPPIGYVSEEQLEEWEMSLDQPDFLMIMQNRMIDEDSMEEQLYQDIPMVDQAQQFLVGNDYFYSIMNDFTGGYRMAAFCAVFILVSVFFLIQNIFGISIQKEIRQNGLLDVLGTTQRQIRQIYYRQIWMNLFWGTLIGILASVMIVLWIVPHILGNLYLYHYGKSAELMVFQPQILIAAIIFTMLVTLLAAFWPIHKAVALTPLEALHYIGTTKKSRRKKRVAKKQRTKRRMVSVELLFMAWENLLRYRNRFLLTIFSIFLGITTALGSVVITKGTDITNKIEARSDFVISGKSLFYGDSTDQYDYDEFSPISEKTKEKLLSVPGVKKDSIKMVTGAYMIVDDREAYMEPILKANQIETYSIKTTSEDTQPQVVNLATVQIVSDSYIKELEQYVKKYNLKIDMDSLKNGSGVIFLHYHQLSPTLVKEANQLVGQPVTFWNLPAQSKLQLIETKDGKHILDHFHYEKMRQMKISGYLDMKAKEFPTLKKTAFGSGIPYFFISAKGFSKLQTKEKIFNMEFDVEKERESSAKAAILKILQENNRQKKGLGMNVQVKSDELSDKQSFIMANRIITGAISMVLILMGLINYFNVIITGMFARQRELAVMESVGMTGKQIKRMLIAESGIYFAIVAGLVLTVGSGILKLLHFYMDSKIAYFKFVYPWQVMIVMFVILLLLCIGVPLYWYGRIEKQSLTQRIQFI
ncbi:MAG: ABC transporter permease [Lachnospiraceae bacterium]|nr:ABC transporter permease [Lachnospiraceae bacterium]